MEGRRWEKSSSGGGHCNESHLRQRKQSGTANEAQSGDCELKRVLCVRELMLMPSWAPDCERSVCVCRAEPTIPQRNTISGRTDY